MAFLTDRVELKITRDDDQFDINIISCKSVDDEVARVYSRCWLNNTVEEPYMWDTDYLMKKVKDGQTVRCTVDVTLNGWYDDYFCEWNDDMEISNWKTFHKTKPISVKKFNRIHYRAKPCHHVRS